MIKILLLNTLFLFPALILANYTILKKKGNILIDGKNIYPAKTLTRGTLVTQKNSWIQLKSDTGVQFTLGPSSTMALGPQSPVLEQGSIRQKLVKKLRQGAVIVKTKQASFGVRGTDFLVLANSLLGESEIIVFTGKVEFSNLGQKKDQILVKGGQWGGLGGRFGAQIGKLMDLPANIINHFDQNSSML